MLMRTLSKALLLIAISVGGPALARPAAAAVHTAQGRKNHHHHRHHERRRERHHEGRENHGPDGERHGEL